MLTTYALRAALKLVERLQHPKRALFIEKFLFSTVGSVGFGVIAFVFGLFFSYLVCWTMWYLIVEADCCCMPCCVGLWGVIAIAAACAEFIVVVSALANISYIVEVAFIAFKVATFVVSIPMLVQMFMLWNIRRKMTASEREKLLASKMPAGYGV